MKAETAPCISSDPAESVPVQVSAVRPRKKSRMRFSKWIRRLHLYLGLILLPWVIFFGLSGMLFNHPEFGEVELIAHLGQDDTEAQGRFEMPRAEELADQIVAELNGDQNASRFRRIASSDAEIEGAFVFQTKAEGGLATLSIDPNDGTAVVRQTREADKPELPEVLTGPVSPSGQVDKEELQKLAEELVKASGIQAKGDIEASARAGAELRFRVESVETGQRWNLSWNLTGGNLSAREIGVGGGPDFYTAMTRFHKTHHYPEQMGARWLWSAFGDATGLTMVFWGVSGAIMWWQIKPTRLLGVAGLSVAGVLAFFIFAGTYSNLHWVPRQARPPSPAGKQDVPPNAGKSPRPAGQAPSKAADQSPLVPSP